MPNAALVIRERLETLFVLTFFQIQIRVSSEKIKSGKIGCIQWVVSLHNSVSHPSMSA
jgi:hypothetical protein